MQDVSDGDADPKGCHFSGVPRVNSVIFLFRQKNSFDYI